MAGGFGAAGGGAQDQWPRTLGDRDSMAIDALMRAVFMATSC